MTIKQEQEAQVDRPSEAEDDDDEMVFLYARKVADEGE